MLVELLVTLLCFVLFGTNVYVITIFFVHRHQLTPKTLLQGNLAFCNLLASYYLSAACLEQVLYGCDTCENSDQSTGWNMTLCSLSASSWALTVVLWNHANQRRREELKREVTVNVTYGFVGATWLYFTVMVLTHMLGLYGWTFDSHDSSDVTSWIVFVLIPFLLPWLFQSLLLWEMSPQQQGVWRGLWSGLKRDEDIAVPNKDELVIVEEEEREKSRDLSPVDEMLVLTTSLYVCGLVSVLLALLLTWLLSTSSPDLLPKLFIAAVCITWINCSIGPFVLLSADQEIEVSRKHVDTVLRAVSRSVLSYLSLYLPASLQAPSHHRAGEDITPAPAGESRGVRPLDSDEQGSEDELV